MLVFSDITYLVFCDFSEHVGVHTSITVLALQIQAELLLPISVK